MLTEEDIISGAFASERLLKGTTMVERGFSTVSRKSTSTLTNEDEEDQKEEEGSGQELLKMYYLSIWKSFLEEFTKPRRVDGVRMYSLFTFKSLHNFHLGL